MFALLEDEPSKGRFCVSLVVRYFIAVGMSIALGFIPGLTFPRVCDNSGIFQAFYPCTMAIALLLGFIVAKVLREKIDTLLWIPGVVWLLVAILDGVVGWNPEWAHASRSTYVIENLFGRNCGDTECLAEFFVTQSFSCSVAYSLGAFLALKIWGGSSEDDSSLSH